LSPNFFSMYWLPCPITGVLLGLCFTGIWRLSQGWAAMLVRGIAEPGGAPAKGGACRPILGR
jgi:hypothetical protein